MKICTVWTETICSRARKQHFSFPVILTQFTTVAFCIFTALKWHHDNIHLFTMKCHFWTGEYITCQKRCISVSQFPKKFPKSQEVLLSIFCPCASSSVVHRQFAHRGERAAEKDRGRGHDNQTEQKETEAHTSPAYVPTAQGKFFSLQRVSQWKSCALWAKMLRFMIVSATSSSCEIGSKILTYSRLIKKKKREMELWKTPFLLQTLRNDCYPCGLFIFFYFDKFLYFHIQINVE